MPPSHMARTLFAALLLLPLLGVVSPQASGALGSGAGAIAAAQPQPESGVSPASERYSPKKPSDKSPTQVPVKVPIKAPIKASAKSPNPSTVKSEVPAGLLSVVIASALLLVGSIAIFGNKNDDFLIEENISDSENTLGEGEAFSI
jgi:hypothetical protein